jgi:L-lactate dehydrogenase
MIGPVPLVRFPLPAHEDLAAIQAEAAEFTRRRGPAVVTRNGHTSAAIAVAVSRMSESVLRDQRRIYTELTPSCARTSVAVG